MVAAPAPTVPGRRCAICGLVLPGDFKHFYRNAGNPGGLSKCCKVCADAAKKRYKAKYNRRRDTNIGIRKELNIGLSERVQYALLTRLCPRCGGRLQQEKDHFERQAPCLTCLTCSREVWLPDYKTCNQFIRDTDPTYVPARPEPRRRKKKKRFIQPSRRKI